MIPTDYQQQQSARYEDLMRTMEWRAFAYRMKEAANFSCAICRQGGPGVELNVHHHAYDRSRLPWEYEASEVAVWCGGENGCHKKMHECLTNFRRYVMSRLTPNTMGVINGALSVGLAHHTPEVIAHALAALMASPSSIVRFATDWHGGNIKDLRKESFAGSKPCG